VSTLISPYSHRLESTEIDRRRLAAAILIRICLKEYGIVLLLQRLGVSFYLVRINGGLLLGEEGLRILLLQVYWLDLVASHQIHVVSALLVYVLLVFMNKLTYKY
jgi:hypothetical protein